jgi:hypothetical protein
MDHLDNIGIDEGLAKAAKEYRINIQFYEYVLGHNPMQSGEERHVQAQLRSWFFIYVPPG